MPPRVALLTGEGLGAVAVVRIWGVGAVASVDSVFRPHRGKSLAETDPGRPRVGRLGEGTGDEVVVLILCEDQVEVQCHGGLAASETVISAIVRAGALRSTSHACVRDMAPSRTRGEAMLDLPHAATLRSASHLLDQAGGALDRALRTIRDDLGSDPDRALVGADSLIASAPVGMRLVSGWRVVLAGRPNVGKSRLLNALLGYDRAIVDPTPGTTRDIIGARTAFDGWPVDLIDTAGLRDSTDPIETAGVARALESQQRADLVLLILDRSRPLVDEDCRLMANHPTALVVANKSDLPRVWKGVGLATSAERGDGVADLAAEIGRRLVTSPPCPGSALPFRDRHVRRLGLVAAAIRRDDLAWARQVLDRWIRGPSAQ